MDSLLKKHQVIVVGSGFGGAATAYALVKSGIKTLLIEKGDWPKRDADDWDGRKILIEQRYKSASPFLIKQYRDKDFKLKYPDEVVGGMSVFYGGACFRFRERDFDTWPIKYADLEPFYDEAESYLEVHGEEESDPTAPPRRTPYPHPTVPLTAPAERIYQTAQKLGYRPFRIPMGINFTGKSQTVCLQCNTCDGFPCRIEAKLDAVTGLLSRAQKLGLEIMTGVLVRKLREENGKITHLECFEKNSGKELLLEADTVVVSGGAIYSPALLLRSNLERFSHHKLIGKYLMRHANAFLSYVFPFNTQSGEIFHKQLCITDFYENSREDSGMSGGSIQDNCMPSAEVISHFAPKGLKTIAGALSKKIQGLLVIAEDEARESNQVSLASETDSYGLPIIKIQHQYSKGDIERRDLVVRHARKILRSAGGLVSNLFEVDTFSHAVGTVRFGEDPKTSILDKDCRFHGIDNLYVCDASFMPTSAGLNPSLTIVANSLRVGYEIAKRLNA